MTPMPAMPANISVDWRAKRGVLRGLALATALALWALHPALAAASLPASRITSPITELQRLVSDERYAEAYRHGKKHPELQGDPHFDFNFGVAAIQIGKTPEGVIALERHLSAVPGNDRARLDLARGYFELGDYVRARQEFEFVLRYNPPAPVRANIERYLFSMQTRDTLASTASSKFYLEAGFGRDSNANAGTFNSQINLPTGPVLLADGDSRAIPSTYSTLTGGAQWVRRVTPALAVFAGGDADLRFNRDAPRFDTANILGYLGFSVVSGAQLFRMTLNDSLMTVDQVKYRTTLGLSGEVQHGLGDGLFITGVVQYSEQAHTGENAIRDAKTFTYGGGLQKAFEGVAWSPSIGAQVTLGTEYNLNKREDLGRSLETFRLLGSVSPLDRLGVSVGTGVQNSRYSAADLAFESVREDVLTTMDLSASYSVTRSWVFRGEVQWLKNFSNQDLYDFRRRTAAIKLRYAF